MSKLEYLIIGVVITVLLWIAFLFVDATEPTDPEPQKEIKSLPITTDNPDVAVPVENSSTVGSVQFAPNGKAGVSIAPGVQMDLDGGGLSIGGF